MTAHTIRRLTGCGGPLVTILWGKLVQELEPLLGDVSMTESLHPSSFSAIRGFFGLRLFLRANAFLADLGRYPVDRSPRQANRSLR